METQLHEGIVGKLGQETFRLLKFDWHRNGVGGEGFRIALVESLDDGRKFIVTQHSENDEETGETKRFSTALCSAQCVNSLANDDISDAMRGDSFASMVNRMIGNRVSLRHEAMDREMEERRKAAAAELGLTVEEIRAGAACTDETFFEFVTRLKGDSGEEE